MTTAALHATRRLVSAVKPYVWVLPALIVYVVFRFYPFLYGIVLSFQEWNGIDPASFVGLKNYRRLLFDDPLFWQALRNNVVFAFGTVLGKNSVALLLAVLLNRSLKGGTVYRTVLFLPVVMSFVVVGLLWAWIFNFSFGLLNGVFRSVGLGIWVQDWLGNPDIALISVIGVDIWKWYGFHMVIFLAGLQGISAEIYEAARIDGANSWDVFWRVTFPLLRPITIINVTISLMGAFNVFDLIYVLTQGGPFNSTSVAAIHMYVRGFKFYEFGYASAVANALFISVIAISGLQIWLMRGESYD